MKEIRRALGPCQSVCSEGEAHLPASWLVPPAASLSPAREWRCPAGGTLGGRAGQAGLGAALPVRLRTRVLCCCAGLSVPPVPLGLQGPGGGLSVTLNWGPCIKPLGPSLPSCLFFMHSAALWGVGCSFWWGDPTNTAGVRTDRRGLSRWGAPAEGGGCASTAGGGREKGGGVRDGGKEAAVSGHGRLVTCGCWRL